MSHEVFQSRFVGHKSPAWHGLGTVFDEPIDATAAFQLMGAFDVIKEPVFRVDANSEGLAIPGGGVYPIKDKYVLTGHFPERTAHGEVFPAQSHHYGVVDKRYELVSPKQLVSLWDMLVKANVETMGTLQKGKRF